MNAIQKRFCEDTGLKPGQFRHLIGLINAAETAQVEEHNTGTPSDTATQKVDDYLKQFGLEADWRMGIIPQIVKGERRFFIPD